MGKYLKEFELTSQYEEYINSTMALLPNVSLTNDNNTVHYNPKVPNYLKFTAVEDSVIKLATFDINTNKIIVKIPTVNLKYSMNGIDFQQWNYETQLYAGQSLYLRGDNPNGFSSFPDLYSFGASTGKFECHGNIMSLLYEDDFEGKLTIPCDYCFCYLFANTNLDNIEAYTLLTAPELPATTLADGCYAYMFQACLSLITTPELPATTLANYCYGYMFTYCTSLITAPELPATTLGVSCYESMFSYCTSLTTASNILPAMTLADKCYKNMFTQCTSLTTAPELPATTLVYECYHAMFNYCTSLTTAPELPATTLISRCYSHMFSYCNKLNYIKMLATDISASTCLDEWVNEVASTGTFIKHPNMTTLPTGISGIPEGWTVQDAA